MEGIMTRRNNAPYWIKTRYGGKCNRCKLGIKKDEEALYYPATKTMLCAGQDCGRQEQRDMEANAFDEAMYSGRPF
jgi:hypothetical protein